MPIEPPDSRIFRLEPMSQPRMPVGQPQMNEMIRMQQADAAIRNQVPWYEQGPGVGRPQALPPQVSQPSQRQLDPYDGMRSIGMPVGQPQMPRIQPMPQQNVSPAFQYAAQNYQRLGGSQRLMDRPIEMMSAAERRTINDMSRAMAEQAQQQQEYDMGRRMMGKGGGAIGSQLPSVMRTAMGAGLGNAIYGLPSLRPMTTSGTFRRPVGTTGTFRDYIS
jgi:hypothetical protein